MRKDLLKFFFMYITMHTAKPQHFAQVLSKSSLFGLNHVYFSFFSETQYEQITMHTAKPQHLAQLLSKSSLFGLNHVFLSFFSETQYEQVVIFKIGYYTDTIKNYSSFYHQGLTMELLRRD